MDFEKSPSRGEKTRDALLSASMDIFGRSGYDAASNRAIAEAAGANQALIGYHFGGKRGLYLAVFEHIAQQMQLELSPLIDIVREQFATIKVKDNDRAERCVSAMETLLYAMLDTLARPGSKSWARLVMREQQDPSDAFEILYEGFMKRILGTLSLIAGMAEGVDEENEATRLRGIFLLSQVLVFVMAPAVVGRHMSWSEGAPANLETIKVQLHRILVQQFIRGNTQ
ncbi:MAG: CerR family C-terminal domain-containing protein [Halioglobus sp.]